MRNKIVAGNWKMNTSREEALTLASEISGMLNDRPAENVTVILAPPFVHLSAIAHLVSGTPIAVAAQNCSEHLSGAYTGEVSAPMIKSVGATYVIIGHSERRTLFNEGHSMLAAKVNQAIANRLSPVFCVGESLQERESGKQEEVIREQLWQGLFHVDGMEFNDVVIAYEPVWAIGTGKTATPGQAQEMHLFIRSLITEKYGDAAGASTRILYGGSCNESNAATLFALPDVDGGLIGGASLKSKSFVSIVHSF